MFVFTSVYPTHLGVPMYAAVTKTDNQRSSSYIIIPKRTSDCTMFSDTVHVVSWPNTNSAGWQEVITLESTPVAAKGSLTS